MIYRILIYGKIPYFSTFNKNPERRFKNTNLFNNIFIKILEEANKYGCIDLSEVFIDSTHIITKYMYKKIDLKYDQKDENLVTIGVSEGIDIDLRAVVEQGDEVIIPEPSIVNMKDVQHLQEEHLK